MVLEHEADVAALATSPLALASAAQDYLRSAGIFDERTWNAFRLDAVPDTDLARLLSTRQRGHLGVGLWLPTCDPGQSSTITGLIRLTPAQHKHAFIGPVAGIAGPVDLDQRDRVVLCDAPLTALRLHQAGVPDVAIVEDPAVLPPLVKWCRARQVVLASHKRPGLAALQAALGGVPATSLLLPPRIDVIAPDLLATLGLERDAVASSLEPPPPITPLLLREIHDYARGRLLAGCADEALRAVGAHIPDLVTAYRIGFLPADYRSALSRTAQRALHGRRLASALVLPAFDAAGLIVDLCIVHATPGSRSVDGIHAEPLGLLAPEMVQGSADLVVTDTVPWLCRSFAAGYRNVLYLRGPADAAGNAERLVRAGVRTVSVQARRNTKEIARILQTAGLTVRMLATGGVQAAEAGDEAAHETANETPHKAPPSADREVPPVAEPAGEPEPDIVASQPPSSVPVNPTPDAHAAAPIFVEEDRTAEVAIFQVGPVRIAIECRDDGGTRRQVVVRAHGQVAQDRFDLANAAQCVRFAGNAGQRVGVPAEVVQAHVAAVLAAQVAREEAQHREAGVVVGAADRALGAAYLDAPDLLDRIAVDATALGWIGEDATKQMLYLGAISRWLPRPLWAVYRARSGAAPWAALGCIASLTPPEDRVVCHRVTDALLRQADPRALRHRLLCIDHAETLRPEAALALRILHERGSVGWATAGVAADLGTTGAVVRDARGPVAVLAAAAGDLDPRCRDDFLAITVDESPEQTARVLEAQRQSLDAATPAAVAAIVARHHAAQRVLERLPVVVPFAHRIAFPASRLRHRAEQACFLTLIQASALLHQRQRPRVGGAVVATEADFAIAVRLSAGVLGETGVGLSSAAARLRQVLVAHQFDTFTMADLSGIFPDWTRWTFRAALQDLCDFGYLESDLGQSRRGKMRRFTLVPGRAPTSTGIHLRPEGTTPLTPAETVPAPVVPAAAVGELADVGGGDSASLSPCARTA